MISSFSGEYRFLSNFYPVEVVFDGKKFPTTENAYQAAKCNPELRDERWDEFQICTAARSKKLGRELPMRHNWDGLKEGIMYQLCSQKFHTPELKELLLKTGDEELVEGNTWGDEIWGVCNGIGQNKLGKILMAIRNELKLNEIS